MPGECQVKTQKPTTRERKAPKAAAVCFNPECAITLFDVTSFEGIKLDDDPFVQFASSGRAVTFQTRNQKALIPGTREFVLDYQFS